MDHAVVAGLFTDARGREGLAASQRQITGYLVDSDGRQVSKPEKPDKVFAILILSDLSGRKCFYIYKHVCIM